MQDYYELSELAEKIIHKYNQVEKKKRYYADCLLSRAEIHTVVAIGKYPNTNVTNLAKIRGITKGAASQMVYKLVDKGLVEKRVSPHSDTEVCLSLTENGQKAFVCHMEYHKNNNENLFGMMRQLSEQDIKQIKMVLHEFDKFMDIRLNEK